MDNKAVARSLVKLASQLIAQPISKQAGGGFIQKSRFGTSYHADEGQPGDAACVDLMRFIKTVNKWHACFLIEDDHNSVVFMTKQVVPRKDVMALYVKHYQKTFQAPDETPFESSKPEILQIW